MCPIVAADLRIQGMPDDKLCRQAMTGLLVSRHWLNQVWVICSGASAVGAIHRITITVTLTPRRSVTPPPQNRDAGQ